MNDVIAAVENRDNYPLLAPAFTFGDAEAQVILRAPESANIYKGMTLYLYDDTHSQAVRVTRVGFGASPELQQVTIVHVVPYNGFEERHIYKRDTSFVVSTGSLLAPFRLPVDVTVPARRTDRMRVEFVMLYPDPAVQHVCAKSVVMIGAASGTYAWVDAVTSVGIRLAVVKQTGVAHFPAGTPVMPVSTK